MKKFIVAIDGLKYSSGSTEYAVKLARMAKAHLVGVFLDDLTYHSYKIYELVGEEEEDIMRRRIKLEEKEVARDDTGEPVKQSLSAPAPRLAAAARPPGRPASRA